MPKPDAWRLDPANYCFSTSITMRFSDLDTQRHLNNVAIAELFESGRVRFIHQVAKSMPTPTWINSVIAALQINYVNEGHFPHDIVIFCGIGKLGHASYVIEQLAMQQDKCIATCDSTLVCLGDAGPSRIPEEVREALEKHRTRGRPES